MRRWVQYGLCRGLLTFAVRFGAGRLTVGADDFVVDMEGATAAVGVGAVAVA